MNYTTLTGSKSTSGSIANWINRSDLPVTDILTEAEAFIYQHLRVREMRALEAAFTFDADASTEALPTRFLDPIEYRPREWAIPLPYVHEQSLEAHQDEDGLLFEGTPSRWAIIGETAHVDVKCAEAFIGRLMFYQQPAALSALNETNFVTTRYPKVLRLSCMAVGFEHAKDTDRALAYTQAAAQAIADAMKTDDLARRGQYVGG